MKKNKKMTFKEFLEIILDNETNPEMVSKILTLYPDLKTKQLRLF